MLKLKNLKIENILFFFKKNEKKIFTALLIFILLLGIFLRTFHHRDWLHFQFDQARDAMIVSNAINDISKLPLLGPHASGSSLQLGPAFYYFQYLAAKIFGARPNVMAWPDLFFSILSLPLFYFFARKYFSQWISLGLLSLFFTTIFIIFYSRFAWNPNSIPFFLLLMTFSLTKLAEEKNKNNFIWLYVSAFAMAIATQLHFFTFFLAPTVLALALIFLRPKIKFRHYLLSLLLVIFIYSPVIYSDIKTNGQNIKAFAETFIKKTEIKESKHNLFEKMFRTLQYSSNFNLIFISSNQNTDIISTKNKSEKIKLQCDSKCRKYLPHMLLAWILFAASLLVFFRKIIKSFKKNKQENFFLMLNLIWLGTFLFILTPLSYKFYPRFFLAGAIPFFIIFGILIKTFLEKYNFKFSRIIVFLVFILCIFLNLKTINKFFEIQNNVKFNSRAGSDYRDLTKPGGENVTLEQLENIANTIKFDSEKNKNKIYIAVDNYYASSIFYLLKYQLDAPIDCYIKKSNYDPKIGLDIYYVLTTDSEAQVGKKILEYNTIEFKKEMGTLVLYKLKPKNYSNTNEYLEGCRIPSGG